MTVLKICIGEWKNNSRDKRELSVCRELGAETLVMAKGNPTDHFRKDTVAGFDVVRFSTRPIKGRFPIILNRIVAIFTWSHYARQIRPDIITGHDIAGILIGWLSTCFVLKAERPVLIYDSHEFELGRSVKRSKFQIWAIKQLEGFLIRRCAFSIMVNNSIANEVQEIYHLKERPVVVRSTPDNWILEKDKIAAVRRELCHALHVPPETFLLMYHGGVMADRGIESLIREVARNPNVVGVILGDSVTPDYLQALKDQSVREGAGDRILFHPAVSLEKLRDYVGAADLGLVLISGVYKSYYLSLPNKFFENIQCLTPIISSNFPELHHLVGKYQIGLVCNPENPEEIHNCVERMRTDRVYYNTCKKNLTLAKVDLCWEKEKEVLKAAYYRHL